MHQAQCNTRYRTLGSRPRHGFCRKAAPLKNIGGREVDGYLDIDQMRIDAKHCRAAGPEKGHAFS